MIFLDLVSLVSLWKKLLNKAEDDKEDVESSLENSLVTLKSCDAGSVKVVARPLASHPNWQEAAIKEPELAVLTANHQRQSE